MLRTRLELERIERENLAPFAVLSELAIREYPGLDQPDSIRTAFARDRARIIHAKAFRRLRGKTQVFVATEGDHFRNRLTHTLEVAQVARVLARALALNEDLAECIALAHDLGHTPFGHVGERKLAELLRPFGRTFEHNRQSHRIVTKLEKKYPSVPGLNLTTAVLTGLAKHETPFDHPAGIEVEKSPSLEAQLVNLADEVAYTSHDCEDGLRAGIFSPEQIQAVPLWARAAESVDPSLPAESFAHRAASRLLELLISDILAESDRRIQEFQIKTLADVEACPEPLVGFSPGMAAEQLRLRAFLFQHFYLAEPVAARADAGADLMQTIFEKLLRSDAGLPDEFLIRLESDPREVVIADFVAGMTDHFAEEWNNNF